MFWTTLVAIQACYKIFHAPNEFNLHENEHARKLLKKTYELIYTNHININFSFENVKRGNFKAISYLCLD